MNRSSYTADEVQLIMDRLGDAIENGVSHGCDDLSGTPEGVLVSVRGTDPRCPSFADAEYHTVLLTYADLLNDAVSPDALLRDRFCAAIDQEAAQRARQAAEKTKRDKAADKRRRATAKARQAKREIALLQRLAAKHPQHLPARA